MPTTSAKARRSRLNGPIIRQATFDSLRKLNPMSMARNPVMFVVEVGSVLTTALLLVDIAGHKGHTGFNLQITLWLWFTVLFANFAEAMAEGRSNRGSRIGGRIRDHRRVGACDSRGWWRPLRSYGRNARAVGLN